MKKNATVYVTTSHDFFIQKIKKSKANGVYRKGIFTDEIVLGEQSYVFAKQDKLKNESFKKGLFLFGMVRKDAEVFLKKAAIKLPKRSPQIEYTETPPKGKVTGADLDHAYWRIAYKLGVITSDTYSKGLDESFKQVRLSALSTLGMDKRYYTIENGLFTTNEVSKGGCEKLQSVYTLIRLTCYKTMSKIKRMLGKDFVCYKTDAIYFRDTVKNKKTVSDFFEKQDLLMKKLE